MMSDNIKLLRVDFCWSSEELQATCGYRAGRLRILSSRQYHLECDLQKFWEGRGMHRRPLLANHVLAQGEVNTQAPFGVEVLFPRRLGIESRDCLMRGEWSVADWPVGGWGLLRDAPHRQSLPAYQPVKCFSMHSSLA